MHTLTQQWERQNCMRLSPSIFMSHRLADNGNFIISNSQMQQFIREQHQKDPTILDNKNTLCIYFLLNSVNLLSQAQNATQGVKTTSPGN